MLIDTNEITAIFYVLEIQIFKFDGHNYVHDYISLYYYSIQLINLLLRYVYTTLVLTLKQKLPSGSDGSIHVFCYKNLKLKLSRSKP